jgi:urea transport system substrate-binding protein
MKKFFYPFFSVLFLSLFILSLYRYFGPKTNNLHGTIKIGIVHSLTGPMVESEMPVVNATLLAIEEINQNGGILGKQIVPVLSDGKSDALIFAQQAEQLLTQEKVVAIFGCWTSADRKRVKPIVEKYEGLLFYPSQYEGLEQSPNIIYLGAVPNQQILPGVRWSFDNLGKRFFLIGSDYIYPHATNKIIKDFVRSLKGEIAGEEYVPLGTHDLKNVVKKIIDTKPTVILNTLVGETNSAFFDELRKAGIASEKIPTMSFSIGKPEQDTASMKDMVGDYVCRSYFENIDNEQNKIFVENFKKKYGEQSVVNDPMESAYFGMHLWAMAVQRAKSTNAAAVRDALKDLAYYAPEGIVHIDPETQHTWRFIRIGKIRFNGQFNTLWVSYRAIRPLPYPTMFAPRETWDQFVNSLYKQWGNQWKNPTH